MNKHNERAELIDSISVLADTLHLQPIGNDELVVLLRRAAAMLEAQPAEQVKGQEAANPNKYAEFWERLPGHLIDHHEGDILTEELLQSAAADLYAKFPDFVASGLKPFGLLLLEEKATTRELVRALREATEPPTFMGEPITTPPAQPAREWVGLTDAEIEKGRDQTFSINNPFCPCDSKTMRKAARWAESKLREKNAGLPAAVPDENRCIRELREYAAKNQGTYIFPGWDGNRVTKYLAAAPKPQPPADDHPLMRAKPAEPQAPDMEASE